VVCRYLNEPYILGTQAEQVVHVKHLKKPGWCYIVRLKPINLFGILEVDGTVNEGGLVVSSLDVGVEDMNSSCTHHYRKSGKLCWPKADKVTIAIDELNLNSMVDRRI
jgi:hypothetical protein